MELVKLFCKFKIFVIFMTLGIHGGWSEESIPPATTTSTTKTTVDVKTEGSEQDRSPASRQRRRRIKEPNFEKWRKAWEEENRLRPPPVAKKPTVQDCIQQNQSRLGPLACVACGAKINSQEAGLEKESINHWVAMLGLAARYCRGGSNYQTEDQLKSYVIQMVSSFGYCTDQEYNRQQIEDNPTYISRILNGETFEWKKFGRTSDETMFLTTFGFNDSYFGGGMSYVKNLFCDSEFEARSLAKRQKIFMTSEYSLTDSGHSPELKNCGKKIRQRYLADPMFNVCPDSITPSVDNMRQNIKFCRAMADACGMNSTDMCAVVQECANQSLYSLGGNGGHGGNSSGPGPSGVGQGGPKHGAEHGEGTGRFGGGGGGAPGSGPGAGAGGGGGPSGVGKGGENGGGDHGTGRGHGTTR